MALIIEVKVVPSSGKQQWVLDKAGKLKCYIKSPPERGLANQEIITLLAKALKLPQGKFGIVAGATGRIKLININAPITLDIVMAALALERQLNIKV